MSYIMSYESFIDSCKQGNCRRGNIINKRCKLQSRQDECYKKYVKIQKRKIDKIKEQMHNQYSSNKIYNLKDEEWELCKIKVTARDNNTCRLTKLLSKEEMDYIKKNFNTDFLALSNIDHAHHYAKGSNPDLKYEVDNVFLLRRYFHSLLDQFKDPITRKHINKEQHEKWWQFIITGIR